METPYEKGRKKPMYHESVIGRRLAAENRVGVENQANVDNRISLSWNATELNLRIKPKQQRR